MTRAIVFGTSGTALLQGMLIGIGFAIAGLPSPVVFGVLAALLSLLPVGGSAFVWVPGGIWLFVDRRWGYGIFMLVWGGLLGGLDNFCGPCSFRAAPRISALAVFHRRSGRHSGLRRHRRHRRPGAAVPGACADRIRRGKPQNS